jgi:hypothetical protein
VLLLRALKAQCYNTGTDKVLLTDSSQLSCDSLAHFHRNSSWLSSDFLAPY